MNILKGLFYINGIDAYSEYGVFLSEEEQDGMENYNALLLPAAAKPHTPVDFQEHNGEDYPDVLVTTRAARDIDLRFTLEADDKADFFMKRKAFISVLRKGQNGWLALTLTDIGQSYRVFYKECTKWTQLTAFEGKVYASTVIRFREPMPQE